MAPISRVLGRRWDLTYNRTTGTYENIYKFCEFQYVPIVKTLEALFQNDDFKRVYFEPNHICEEGVYKGFCCGEIFRNNVFFNQNPNAIRIQLYYDDFSATWGSKSQATLQIGAVYFTIDNLPPHLNSHLENIHLVALFHVCDLLNFGVTFNNILAPIIEDLKYLHDDGIDIGNLTVPINATFSEFSNC